MKLDEKVSGGVPSHIVKWMQLAAQKFNALASGRMSAREGQLTTAPTTGTWTQGDMVWHSSPVEAGSASSKYVVIGWICTVGGTPGTWLQMRVLTGN